jgi:membrane protein implicated in regulation of membrane protease activity
MDNLVWILWVVLGLILIVAEIFTTGFVLLWFGIAALLAAFAALLGFGLPVQFGLFFIVSVGLMAASRMLFVNYLSREATGDELRTGVDSLPGQVGTVTVSSKGALKAGEVKVFGSLWTAYPAEGEEPLQEGDRVTVERVKGASIYVRRAHDEPDWRKKALTDKSEP